MSSQSESDTSVPDALPFDGFNQTCYSQYAASLNLDLNFLKESTAEIWRVCLDGLL